MDILNTNPQRRPFKMGKFVMTLGAMEALIRSEQNPFFFINRHLACDWGLVCPSQWRANNNAIANEGQADKQGLVLSAYDTRNGERLWVVTETNRSATTIMTPEEY